MTSSPFVPSFLPRWGRAGWGLLFAVAFSAHASFPLLSQIEVDKARIEQEVAKRFPVEMRWLETLDVTASTPRLRLLPANNRVATDIDLIAGRRVLLQSVRGALSLEGALRFEPRDASLRYSRVSVERFSLAGLPDAFAPHATRLGAWLAEQLLDDIVLYTLDEQQRAALRVGNVRPGEIRVTERGLSVKLEPISK